MHLFDDGQMIESPEQVARRFQDALDSFVGKLRGDPNIAAVVLAGSLAYDKVWHKSDMDVTLVIRDQKIETASYCISEDNIVINVSLMTRTDFRQMLQRGKAGGGSHSMFARAKVVYTTDPSLVDFLDDVRTMGADDIEASIFSYSSYLLGYMEKIEKWLVVKKNPLYAQYYVLKAVDVLADMYLILKGVPPNRESVLKVMELDPGFMAPFYQLPMAGPMTGEQVYATLERMRAFLADHLDLLSRPAIRYMEDGEIKTITMLTKQFDMHSHGIYHIFDFLTEMDVIEKVSQTIRITPKGKKSVEEVAFLYTKNLLMT